MNTLNVFLGTICIVNLVRMTLYRVGADLYYLGRRKNPPANGLPPSFSVIIPAHNEADTIVNTLKSLSTLDYPRGLLQVIVAANGTTDRTLDLVREFKNFHPDLRIDTLDLPEPGKAGAINQAIRAFTLGEFTVTLDADSTLAPDALKRAAEYFRDPQVMVLGANIKVAPQPGLIHLVQAFAYLIAFQMKRAHHVFNIEYIVGGAAAFYRRQFVEDIGLFDRDTVTEDMDFTVKVIRSGNRRYRIAFASDVVAHTQVPQTLSDLIRQRFRWKYGRNQTFFKHRHIFFAALPETNRVVNFFFMPLTFTYDVGLFLEPVVLGAVFFLAFSARDPGLLLSGLVIVTGYLFLNVLAEDTIPWKEKLAYFLVAPTMYIYLYLVNLAEYTALIKNLFKAHTVPSSLNSSGDASSWTHVRRAAV